MIKYLKVGLNTLLLLTFSMQLVCAQKGYIKFDTLNCDRFVHGVSSVIVEDMRSDKNALLGKVGIGLMDREQAVMTEDPLSISIENYYRQLSQNKITKEQKLVVLLHTFYVFDGKSGHSSEMPYFKFAADYFISESNELYSLLGTVDTSITVMGFNVTKELMHTIDRSLCGLYEQLYQNPRSDKKYSYQDVINYSDEQKLAQPAYRRKGNDNAVYRSWEDFKMLNSEPNETIYKNGQIFKVNYFNSKGKARYELAYHNMVISFEGKLYYNIERVFYEMYRKKDDFYVMGRTTNFTKNNAMPLGMMFGVVGAAISSSSNNEGIEMYEFKIDYKKGDLIPIKAIIPNKGSQKMK